MSTSANLSFYNPLAVPENTSQLLPEDVPRVPGGSFQDQTQIQAVVQRPIKYVENVFGQDIRVDPRLKNYDVEMSFHPKQFGRERMNLGSLPYTTSPRLRRNMSDRMIPEDTKLMWSRSCWNECLNAAGPWYLRHWQIWDYAPFLPKGGNVALDPRYGAYTKTFTEPFKLERGVTPKSIKNDRLYPMP